MRRKTIKSHFRYGVESPQILRIDVSLVILVSLFLNTLGEVRHVSDFSMHLVGLITFQMLR